MGNKTSEQKREYQKGYDQRTGYAAQRKYKQEHGKSFTFVVYSPQENDIIEQLLSQTNKAGYIKRLIREDIERKRKFNREAISALEEEPLELLGNGSDIYYVNYDESKIEHGVVFIAEYKDGELKNFSVNFDDGAFDVFYGDSYGKRFFSSRPAAENAFVHGIGRDIRAL